MAIGATAVWEVRTTGSDSNGGFYTSGGVDYSQSDTAILIVDGSSYTATCTTTTITVSGATLSTNYIGNGLCVTGGSGQTQGFYQITAVNVGANTITLDRTTGGSGLDITFRIGGAVATPGIVAGSAVAGNTVWVKAGTYTLSSSSNVAGGRITFSAEFQIHGYITTRGDITAPTASAPVLTCGANSVTAVTISANHSVISGVVINGDKATRTGTVGIAGSAIGYAVNCIIQNTAGNGSANSNLSLSRTIITGAGGSGINPAMSADCCIATGCTSAGFRDVRALTSSLSYSNSGNGIEGTGGINIVNNCASVGNTGDGFEIQGNRAAIVSNSVFYGNGGYGIDAGSLANGILLSINNAFASNTSGATTGSKIQASGSITLSGNPFVNSAGGNWNIDGSSAGGIQLKSAGSTITNGSNTVPGTFDVGANQIAPASGGVSAARIVNRT